MATLLALSLTIISGIALATLHELGPLAGYGAFLVLVVSVHQRTWSILSRSLLWAFPFTFPLLLIHGVINPSYSTGTQFGGIVPLRPDGAIYALLISIRVWIITIIGAIWMCVNRDRLIDEMVQWNIPMPWIVIGSQAISTLDFISRRIRSVYLAQQARGIAVGPGILARIRALPTVVIPVVLSTLVDAHARAQCLHSRGLGVTRIRIPRSHKTPPVDILTILIVFGFYVGAVMSIAK
ncbi:MAG: energy-coupling factor transporter transmembrane component T [Candidatus Thiodiazotropha sp.]